jgi:hypothetical protein
MSIGIEKQIGSNDLSSRLSARCQNPPVEIIVGFKLPVRAGFAKYLLLSRHRNKDLHREKQSCENTLVSILFNLITRWTDRNTAFLEFDMNDRHSVN